MASWFDGKFLCGLLRYPRHALHIFEVIPIPSQRETIGAIIGYQDMAVGMFAVLMDYAHVLTTRGISIHKLTAEAW